MDLSDRKRRVLKEIVEQHICSAAPVGSKALLDQFPVSSATLRADMHDLEKQGLLEQPHTSSGRVPTAEGYRLYVSQLMDRALPTPEDARLIEQSLRAPPDDLAQAAAKLTSRVTALPGFAQLSPQTASTVSRFDLLHLDDHSFIIVLLLSDKSVHNRLVTLPGFVRKETLMRLEGLLNAGFTDLPESDITAGQIAVTERVSADVSGITAAIVGFMLEILAAKGVRSTHLSGAEALWQHPEYRDPDKAQKLLDFLSGEDVLSHTAPNRQGIQMIIGAEDVSDALKDASVVLAKYQLGDGMYGLIGVAGPTRMDYAGVAAKLEFIASSLKRQLMN